MADRFSTSLAFGPLNDRQCDALTGSGDPILPPARFAEIREEIEKIGPDGLDIDSDRVCWIECYEARYDDFDGMSRLLCELGIGWDWHQEPKYEYDGEVSCWRPGMTVAWTCEADADGNPHVAGCVIQKWLEDHADGTKNDLVGWLSGKLGWAIPPLVPEATPA